MKQTKPNPTAYVIFKSIWENGPYFVGEYTDHNQTMTREYPRLTLDQARTLAEELRAAYQATHPAAQVYVNDLTLTHTERADLMPGFATASTCIDYDPRCHCCYLNHSHDFSEHRHHIHTNPLKS